MSPSWEVHLCKISWNPILRQRCYRADTKGPFNSGCDLHLENPEPIFSQDISFSWEVHLCQISWNLMPRYKSYWADRKWPLTSACDLDFENWSRFFTWHDVYLWGTFVQNFFKSYATLKFFQSGHKMPFHLRLWYSSWKSWVDFSHHVLSSLEVHTRMCISLWNPMLWKKSWRIYSK